MKSKDGQFLLKLGQKIKSVRKLKKLSQEALAEKINIHPTTIGRIEIRQTKRFHINALPYCGCFRS